MERNRCPVCGSKNVGPGPDYDNLRWIGCFDCGHGFTSAPRVATVNDKPKFYRPDALAVAKEMCELLGASCLPGFLKVCGSLRRMNKYVGDVEIVYVSKVRTVPDGLFDTMEEVEVDKVLADLLDRGVIEKRLTGKGATTWGPKNKLGVHVKSRIPVDFFASDQRKWWNMIVCRTGSAQTNIRICEQAKKQGMKWHPYGAGFTTNDGRDITVDSEEAVFRLVGLPYLEPKDR